MAVKGRWHWSHCNWRIIHFFLSMDHKQASCHARREFYAGFDDDRLVYVTNWNLPLPLFREKQDTLFFMRCASREQQFGRTWPKDPPPWCTIWWFGKAPYLRYLSRWTNSPPRLHTVRSEKYTISTYSLLPLHQNDKSREGQPTKSQEILLAGHDRNRRDIPKGVAAELHVAWARSRANTRDVAYSSTVSL